MESFTQMTTQVDIGEPTETVELRIAWEKLADLDFFTKSDPVCEVYLK